MELVLVLLALAVLVGVALVKAVHIVPAGQAGLVERLGKFDRTLSPGLHVVVPLIDRVRRLVDLGEQVVTFEPQPIVTEDNRVVGIDSVIHFQVVDPAAATYQVADPVRAIEQVATTTLRNVVGGMDLEETLSSRTSIDVALRGVLDEATAAWGIRVLRFELKDIDTAPATGRPLGS